MLRFFRTNSSNNFFLLITYAAILQLHGWFNPLEVGSLDGMSPVANDLFGWFYSWAPANGIISRLLALVLVLGQALHFAKTVQQYKIIAPVNWLVALFYILFAAFFPAFQYFSPELLAMTLMLIAFRLIFATYYLDQADSPILDASLLTGIVALLYIPYAVLLIFALASLMIIRSLHLREAVIFVVGFIVPWFLNRYRLYGRGPAT